MKVNYNSPNSVRDTIEYYQKNKEDFFINCLGSDENDRQYLYDDWIEDFFMTSYIEHIKEYFHNTGFPEYWEEPFISYTDDDWLEYAEVNELEL